MLWSFTVKDAEGNVPTIPVRVVVEGRGRINDTWEYKNCTSKKGALTCAEKKKLVFKFEMMDRGSWSASLTRMVVGRGSLQAEVNIVLISREHMKNLHYIRTMLTFAENKTGDVVDELHKKSIESLDYLYTAKTFGAKERFHWDTLKHKLANCVRRIRYLDAEVKDPVSSNVATTTTTSSTPPKADASPKESPTLTKRKSFKRQGSVKKMILQKERGFKEKAEAKKRQVYKIRIEKDDFEYYQWSASDKTKDNVAVLLLTDWTEDCDIFMGLQDKHRFIDDVRKLGRVVLIRWPFDESVKKESWSRRTVLPSKELMAVVYTVINSIIKNNHVDFVVPLCLAHAGWMGVELRVGLPRRVPAVVFVDYSMDHLDAKGKKSLETFSKSKDPKDWEAAKVALDVTHDCDDNVDYWASVAWHVLEMYNESETSPMEALGSSTKKGHSTFHAMSFRTQKVASRPSVAAPWLVNKSGNRKSLAKELSTFLSDRPFPPVPPGKPKYDPRTGRISWNTRSKSNTQINRLHFFLVDDTETDSASKVESSSLVKKAGKIVTGAGTFAGAAFLFSAAVAGGIAVAGLGTYAAVRAIRGSGDRENENMVCKGTMTGRSAATVFVSQVFAEQLREKKTPPLVPNRTYHVYASCETDAGVSAMSSKLDWTCPANELTVPDGFKVNVEKQGPTLGAFVDAVWREDKRSAPASDDDEAEPSPHVLYEIRYGKASMFNSWKESKLTRETSVAIEDVEPNCSYVAQIRSVSAGGTSAWSEKASFDAPSKLAKREGKNDETTNKSSSSSSSRKSERVKRK